jgi:hypothetical protein
MGRRRPEFVIKGMRMSWMWEQDIDQPDNDQETDHDPKGIADIFFLKKKSRKDEVIVEIEEPDNKQIANEIADKWRDGKNFKTVIKIRGRYNGDTDKKKYQENMYGECFQGKLHEMQFQANYEK